MYIKEFYTLLEAYFCAIFAFPSKALNVSLPLITKLNDSLQTSNSQVGVAMVVVESAVTSIYICYAEDPLLIQRWDHDFFNQISETLHQRLQHRSSRAREVLTHNHLDAHIPDNP
jgi:hypothetical protein